jgi:glycine/D-amino acid oxidase-like deaminating enzyme
MKTERQSRWGEPPWRIDFVPQPRVLAEEVDFAVIGGGFTGLAAAAWLRRLAPEKTVAVLEAGQVGAGASGRTGGIALAETAAGDLPGLGDVLGGFASVLRELAVECDLNLSGAWEIGRSDGLAQSPIAWEDSGTLRVVREVPGGTVDAGKLVSGLACAAEKQGAVIREWTPVRGMAFEEPLKLELPKGFLHARKVLVATNAMSLELSALAGRAEPKFTLAVATEPVAAGDLEAIGLGERKPFYTVDLPYLWGRVLASNSIVWGAGLVHLKDWREFLLLDIASGQPAELLTTVEKRVRALHPALRSAQFTHRWGGPILVANSWRPVFARHPRSPNALVLGAYAGHGVALSVYLGRWAAEAFLGRRELPEW